MTPEPTPGPPPDTPEPGDVETGVAEAEEGTSGLLARLTDPRVLFPLLALAGLAVIWGVTLNLIRVEEENARSRARATSKELLETYEAQVIRVLREIDRGLKSLRYAYQLRGDASAALSDLDRRELLPPDFVFTVSLTDPEGEVVATTGRSAGASIGDTPFFRHALEADSLVVDRPVRREDGWRLRFGRSLAGPEGEAGGVAVVEVDASFFVSGYERSKLGDRGVLGVLGTDGVFRARRSGDSVSAGTSVVYDSLVPEQGPGETETVLAANPWDGVRRYTSARQLFAFPVAVVVGLSEQERLAPARERADTFLQRAAAGSFLLLLVVGVLGRTNWKLERVRRREAEARVAHARRVEHLAYHDGLTGLPNRSFLGKLLEDRIAQARRHGDDLAVLFLDLDRFKQINDTLGHEAGDELLRQVSERLEATLRESDVVARMGGDEFVVLVSRVEDEEEIAIATVAEKILATLKEPYQLFGQEFRVTASIGISVYPADGRDEQTLMKNADIAMYQAKDAGRNSFAFFSEEMSTASIERLNLEASLRRALKEKEFDLHYQPRRDLENGRITGMEALLRWEHPEFGTVEPREFLPVAEETGLIVPLGRWVLRTACRQNVAWQEQGLPRLNMAVNLSARQFFDEDLVDDVAAALGESGMDAELLELEIGESVLARDAGMTVPVLRDLKELGVRITIDNFGTGYSSLSVLRQFPLDTIKIDRIFLRGDEDPEIAGEVADAILAMGRQLSPSVVANGVETREQAEFLRAHACKEVQGFFFNRPVPADEFTEVLREEEIDRPPAGA